ncbi:hypothetical protein [Sphingobium sp. EP60837]|uniref:hypothetical protein n=1 Tax=Sphingobium sp. EP60837 TaxID=1855519 RepID=UPI0012E6FCB1|nr:hypothetical protein [Sphingobium sp. EP60837]
MANLIYISNPSSRSKGEVRPQNAETASKAARNRRIGRKSTSRQRLGVRHQFHHPEITGSSRRLNAGFRRFRTFKRPLPNGVTWWGTDSAGQTTLIMGGRLDQP